MAAGRNIVLVRDWVGYVGVRSRALLRRLVPARHAWPPRVEEPEPSRLPAMSRRPATPRPVGVRARARLWRRTRPFWGGMLLILAGGELLLIPLSGILLHGAVKLVVYIGIGGVFGVLIGILLITCGLLLWFTPAHRTFYAVAGAVLALLSFITSNLGGFFLGMLLGIIGGSLAFGWTPGELWPQSAALTGDLDAADDGDAARDGDAAYDAAADADTADFPWVVTEGDAGENTADDEEPRGGRHRGAERGAGRLMASAALPAVLLGSLLTGPAAPAAPGHAGAASHAGQPAGCILFVICLPSSGSSPAPDPAPSDQPTSQPTSPISLTNPSPSPSTGSSQGPAPDPSASGQPGRTALAPPSGLAAALATSVITAGSATLNGLAYQGTAKVPVAGGTETMMKFTLDSLTLSGNVTATVTDNGQTTVTQSSQLAFSGGVTLYATKLSGSLLGIPLTLTPKSVVSLLLHVLNTVTPLVPVTMTNVTTDQPFVLSGSLQATNLVITS